MLKVNTCYILAGGESKRFGEDKLLYEVNDKRVIERVCETAKRVFRKVYVVAKNKEKFPFLGVPVVLDEFKESASIVGLYTALKHSKEEYIFILSGDLPLIKEETLLYIVENFKEPVSVARTEKLHTLVGIYSKYALKKLEEKIRKGDYRIWAFLKEIGYNEVKIPRELEHTLINMNTKEDLKRILAIENHY